MTKKIYTTGVFDILHRGHLNILTQAAALGDLYVGVQTDPWVEKSKGRPTILSTDERMDQLRSLPFVKQVIPYGDPNPIPMYESLKPEIVVQGDDWLYSGDRTAAIAYLREHGIRLLLLPRTEGISTTEIRKRVQRSARNDRALLADRLKIVPIADLLLYEEFEEAKVKDLMRKIETSGYFHNPISVVKEMIVIDGNNRLEALRRLGAKWVPVVVYDYDEIDLVANVHFIKDGKKTRLSEFAREEGKRVEFRKRTPDDIRAAVRDGKKIPNGETFHRVPFSVIRLPFRLSVLCEEDPGLNVPAIIDLFIDENRIRFYQSSVYVCDE